MQKKIWTEVIRVLKETFVSIEFIAVSFVIMSLCVVVYFVSRVEVPDIPAIDQKATVAEELAIANINRINSLEQKVDEQGKIIQNPIIIERRVPVEVKANSDSVMRARAARLRNAQQQDAANR